MGPKEGMITRGRKRELDNQAQPPVAPALPLMEGQREARPSGEDAEDEQEAENEEEQEEPEQASAAPISQQSVLDRRHTGPSRDRRQQAKEEAARAKLEEEAAEAEGEPSRPNRAATSTRPHTRAFQRRTQQNTEQASAREQEAESSSRAQKRSREHSESDASAEEGQTESQLPPKKIRGETRAMLTFRERRDRQKAREEEEIEESDEGEEGGESSANSHTSEAAGTFLSRQPIPTSKENKGKGKGKEIQHSMGKKSSVRESQNAPETEKSSQEATRASTTTAAATGPETTPPRGDFIRSPAPHPSSSGSHQPAPTPEPHLSSSVALASTSPPLFLLRSHHQPTMYLLLRPDPYLTNAPSSSSSSTAPILTSITLHLLRPQFTHCIDHHVRNGNIMKVVRMRLQVDEIRGPDGLEMVFERQTVAGQGEGEVRTVVDNDGWEWLKGEIEARGVVVGRDEPGAVPAGSKLLVVKRMVVRDEETGIEQELRVGEGLEEAEVVGTEEQVEVRVLKRAQVDLQEI
ncbi:MAG: hypothetical protein Q9160_004203 [Pyrenula sp. 1 TL-2023]